MRLYLPHRSEPSAAVAEAIADAGAMLGAVDIVRVSAHELVRDVTVACTHSAHAEMMVLTVQGVASVIVATVSECTFLMHNDQHGTAIVVLGALLNALRVVGKRAEDVSVVVVGAGAAGRGLNGNTPRLRCLRCDRL